MKDRKKLAQLMETGAPISCTLMFHYGRDKISLFIAKGAVIKYSKKKIFRKSLKTFLNYGICSAKY